MTRDEMKTLEAALPNNSTAVVIGRDSAGQYYTQGASKWDKQYSEEASRAYQFAMGIFQLFNTSTRHVEQLGNLRAKAEMLKGFLDRMPEDAKENVVDINPALIARKTEEIIPNDTR